MKIQINIDVQRAACGFLVTIKAGSRTATYLPERAPTLAAARCWALLQSLELALAPGGDHREVEIRCAFTPDRRQHYWRILQLRLAQGGTTLHLVHEEADTAGASWWSRWRSPVQALA
ncbi:hypothetical protein IP70_16785 [alpha proteobacterium AAP38]|nr:hypothetical protein IP70_16785 [alpha proteobacterium AAP38]